MIVVSGDRRIKSRTPRRAHPDEPVEAPAKIHAGHGRRNLDLVAGGRTAWINHGEHPLTWAYAKGHLEGRSCRYSSRERYDAGSEYREMFETMHRSGRDSTDLDVVRGGGCGAIVTVQADAIRKIIAIDSRMEKRNRSIIRHVCGEAWKPADAVRDACGADYVDATLPRLREALDCLIEAMRDASAKRWATVVLTPPEM